MLRKRVIAGALLAVMAGLAVFAGLYVVLGLLGIVTGVIAPCATAPEWWIQIFLYVIYSMPLWGGAVAIYSGWSLFHWYERRYSKHSLSTKALTAMTRSEMEANRDTTRTKPAGNKTDNE